MLSLSKLGDIPIRLHRAIPDNATLKQVTVKKEPTGEWFATFGVQKPSMTVSAAHQKPEASEDVEMNHESPEPPENPEK